MKYLDSDLDAIISPTHSAERKCMSEAYTSCLSKIISHAMHTFLDPWGRALKDDQQKYVGCRSGITDSCCCTELYSVLLGLFSVHKYCVLQAVIDASDDACSASHCQAP